MGPLLAALFCSVALAAAAAEPDDVVTTLPGYGKPKTKQYAGHMDATPDGSNRLFYWFVEAEVGSTSPDVPFLVWLNGGPGASSMMGLLTENLGPQKVSLEGEGLVDNPHHITKKYHLMAVDNPVGAGFSFTTTGAYVRSEEEMRAQFVYALRGFFQLHPEYKNNPLWITGESYAGKYVPNIAYEIATNAAEMPLQGILVGNGMYNELVQYTTIGEMAFGAGIIDEKLLQEEQKREQHCLQAIKEGSSSAFDFCENQTVRWLYEGPEAAAGEFFYYDFGMSNAHELDLITDKLGAYLNDPAVKAALHVGDATWVNADEVGPVAQALAADGIIPSALVVEKLLAIGLRLLFYNGVQDGSVCNHIGNLRALLALQWTGAGDFAAAPNKPWPAPDQVMGHIRSARNLIFATVLRTGHLVPTVQPDSFAVLWDMVLSTSDPRQSDAPQSIAGALAPVFDIVV